MDQLELLRSARSYTVPPLADLEPARAAMDQAIAHDTSQERLRASRRRVLLPVTFAVAACTAVVVALVASGLVDPGMGPAHAPADASEVLNRAAQLTIKTTDPVVGDDQYLKVTTKAAELTSEGDANGGGVSWIALSTSTLYVPGTPKADWVLIQSLAVPYQFFGPDSKAAADKNWDQIIAEHGAQPDYYGAPDGAFFGAPTKNLPSELEKLPRDEKKLLDHFYGSNPGAGSSKDGEAFTEIVDILRTGYVPAGLRAALYRTLALIPGVTVTDRGTTLDGKRGISLGRTETNGHTRQEIVIDSNTGAFIGEREILLTADVSFGIPAGAVIAWTAVSSKVSDSAPSQPNG